jgi:hypothetical protein
MMPHQDRLTAMLTRLKLTATCSVISATTRPTSSPTATSYSRCLFVVLLLLHSMNPTPKRLNHVEPSPFAASCQKNLLREVQNRILSLNIWSDFVFA